jgi:hypothetical protein
MKYIYFVCSIMLIISGCKQSHNSHGIDWDELENDYSRPKDSLKLAALRFIRENIDDVFSEHVNFYDKKNREKIDIDFSKVKNDRFFKKYLIDSQIFVKTFITSDTSFLSTEKVKGSIEHAFSIWRKYPWNRNASFDLFLNYLLPYKVIDEYPDDWRSSLEVRFLPKVQAILESLNDSTVKEKYSRPNTLYYSFNVDGIDSLFSYTPDPPYFCKRPGYYEIESSRKGDCFGGSYLGVYILRSIGIPATVDYIPYWGSKNGAHAAEVFADEKGRLVTASGREIANSAKVFRLTFKRENIWKDSIAPFVDSSNFFLSNLKNNHWVDVTSFHTRTKDIVLSPPEELIHRSNYAYICVFNYGEWYPIYWGSRDYPNNGYAFRKMGYPMLYRLAIPVGNTYTVLGPTYVIDSLGVLRKSGINKKKLTDGIFRKVNNGKDSWVKKNLEYELFALDENSSWLKVKTAVCSKDSLIRFNHIPSGCIYRLIEKADERQLSRPFTYGNEGQIWW